MAHTYRQIQALFAMSRPLQLVAVTLVYIMGTSIALSNQSVNGQAFLFGYFSLIPVAASIHYANEYADHETDALTQRTPFSGGSGALSRTGLSPIIALRAAQSTLVLGTLIAFSGWFLNHLSLGALTVLALGACFGWMYSLPPLALAWHGWGELDNAMLGGLLLPLYGYAAQTGTIAIQPILICLPFGILVFVNLLATTWPDRHADAIVGKYTLATRWSVAHLRRLYWLSVLVAYGVLFSSGIMRWIPLALVYGGMLSLPLTLWGAWGYTRQHSPFPAVSAMVLLLIVYIGVWIQETL